MKLEVIRQLPNDNKVELLMEVDKELMELYKTETGAEDFDQDSFDEWINSLIGYALESENYNEE